MGLHALENLLDRDRSQGHSIFGSLRDHTDASNEMPYASCSLQTHLCAAWRALRAAGVTEEAASTETLNRKRISTHWGA